MSLINPKCDGDHCTSKGEVRVLKVGDSNLILCRECFHHELGFNLPRWSDLKIYSPT